MSLYAEGYHFVYANSSSAAGGVGMYISSLNNFKVIGKNILQSGCEDIWVRLENKKTLKKAVIASIYRHSSSDSNMFIKSLNFRLSE